MHISSAETRRRLQRRPRRRALYLGFTLALFATLALSAIPAAAQPHGGYLITTFKCHDCHSPHYAKGPTLFDQVDEKHVCYSCHDGTGSSYDVQTQFGESVIGTSTALSHHPVPEGEQVCGTCHTPHAGPAEGNLMSLAVGTSRVETSSAVCGTCHGQASSVPLGNHLSTILGTPHEDSMSPPPSGSGIECVACHEPHGSSNPSLVRTAVQDSWGVTQTVVTTATVTPLCLTCHARAGGTFPGATVYTATRHSVVTSSSVAATGWPGLGKRNGDCDNCHEPHGKTGQPRYTRGAGDQLCFTCHDAAGTTKPSGYSYRGQATYSAAAHGSITSTLAVANEYSDSNGFMAWESTTAQTPSAPGQPMERARLDAMRVVDGQMAVTSLATATGEFDYQMYRFKMPASSADVGSVQLDWVGYGEAIPGYPLTLSVWNTTLNAGAGGWQSVNSGVYGTTTTLTVGVAPAGHVTADGYMYVLTANMHARKTEILSGPTASAATTAGVIISWTTRGPSSSWVDIGSYPGAYTGTFGSAAATMTHSVVVPLTGAAVYHYRVASTDVEGTTATSTDQLFGAPSPTIVPVAGGGNVGTIAFQWSLDELLRGPYTYQLSLRNSAGTVTDYPWQSTTTMTVGLPYDSYTWWVSAKDAAGVLTAPSASNTFLTWDSSCPILYTWDGSRWNFITDVMGFGTLGVKQGTAYRYPPPVEDSRIDPGSLAADNGEYRIKLVDEKPEIEFIDKVGLRVVDHPAGTNVYLNDYTRSGTTTITNPINVYTTRDERPVVKATYTDVPLYTGPAVTDQDITAEVSNQDAQYAPTGFFDDNQYTFDLGDLTGAPEIKLVVNGWTQYATPTERAAWERSGGVSAKRLLQVQDASGNWVTVDSKLPFIPGYTKTVVYDLTGKFPAGVTDYKVRMTGFYRTYIDSVKVDTSKDETVTITDVAPKTAGLGFKGISRYERLPVPHYDYDAVIDSAPPTQEGAFTRFGGVLPLLQQSDDMYAVLDSGDELSMTFDASPAQFGRDRTVLIHTDGYFQELTGKVDPMPYHAMSNYPYAAPEQYPADQAHLDYLQTYQTRIHVAGGTPTTPDTVVAQSGPLQAVVNALSRAFAWLAGQPALVPVLDQPKPRSIHTDAVFLQIGYRVAAQAGSSCTACHTVHGQSSPDGGVFPALLGAQQTRTCTGNGNGSCHSAAANSAGNIDIYASVTADAAQASHHDLTSAAQAASGAKLACSDCHNPHRDSSLDRYSDPNSLDRGVSTTLPGDYVGPAGEVYALVGAQHDGVPPVMSNIDLTVQPSGIPWITWTTDERATTWIDWGTTSGYELGSFGSTLPLATAHAATPDTVTAGTTYHYRLRSADALGNQRTSADATYAVTAPPPSPVPDKMPDQAPTGVFTMTMTGSAVTAPDGHAAQYQFQMHVPGNVSIPTITSGWLAAPSWSTTQCIWNATYAFSIRARDAFEPYAVSPWSSESTFTVAFVTSGSCPFVFTWDGSSWVFGADQYATGKLGTKSATGYLKPTPQDAYVLPVAPAEQNGVYGLKLVEERFETDYLDQLKLYAIDTSPGVDVYSELPDLNRPFKGIPGALHTAASPTPAVSVVNVTTGEDLTSKVATDDGVLAQLNTDENDFTYQTLEIDPGDISSASQVKLLLDAFSVFPSAPAGTNLASTFGPRTKLQVQDGAGAWVSVPTTTAVLPKPFEFMRPYTLDISNIWQGPSRRIRLSFLFKTYIDSLRFDTTSDAPLQLTEVPLASATLRHHGIDGKAGTGDDQHFVYGASNDATGFLPGDYTRYGDVSPLLSAVDDKFVVYGGGDELDLSFTPLPEPAAGTTRHYLLATDGYYKDLKTDVAKTVEPLPFAAMSNFPYADPQHYPNDQDHLDYLSQWNTRVEPNPTGLAFLGEIGRLMAQARSWFRGLVPGGAGDRPATAVAPDAPRVHPVRRVALLADASSRLVEPGPRHYSLNTDAIFVRSDGLGRAPVSYLPVAGWQSSGAATPTPSAPGSAVDSVTAASSADGTYWTTDLTSTDRQWNWQVVGFNVPRTDLPAASDLRLVWDGYGEPTAGYPTRLALWDFRTSTWDVVSRDAFGAPGEVALSRGRVPSSMCLACHDNAPPSGVVIPSTVATISTTWPAAKHGGAASPGFGGDLIGEYQRNTAPNLPCVECHDPHGSANLYHVPASVKDKTGISYTSSSGMANLCSACHKGTATDWHAAGCSCHMTPPDPMDPHNAYGAWYPSNTSDCARCHAHGRTFVHKDCHGACHGMQWSPTL